MRLCKKTGTTDAYMFFVIVSLIAFPLLGGEPPGLQGEMGMEYIGAPPEINRVDAAAAATLPGSLYRYPAKFQNWKEMDEKKAYFRDLWVGQETHIYDAVDGDTWTCKATLPDESVREWGNVKFYSSHDGNNDCFVSSSGWTVCGTRNITIR
ncbi:MAG: hypothetical protein U9Q07_07410 [Planctomycetota bacterium]|nr:hypothetical protein [Planctomycetota bacterium]